MKGEGKVIFTKLLGDVEELEAGTFRSYHGMFYSLLIDITNAHELVTGRLMSAVCTFQNIPFYLSRNAFKLRPSLVTRTGSFSHQNVKPVDK